MTSRPDLAARNRANATHGHTRGQGRGRRSPTYVCWMGMRERCLTATCKDYHRYGGRGISVCARWDAFENFLADMGERPSIAYSIERGDVDGNYEPGNCRWATNKEQSNNRRSNVFVEFNGERKTIAQWAEVTGLERKTLEYRIRTGWNAERALTTPSITNRKNTNVNFTGVNQ